METLGRGSDASLLFLRWARLSASDVSFDGAGAFLSTLARLIGVGATKAVAPFDDRLSLVAPCCSYIIGADN